RPLAPWRGAREPPRSDPPDLSCALRGRAPAARHRLAQGALRGRRRRRGRARRRRPDPVRPPRRRSAHRVAPPPRSQISDTVSRVLAGVTVDAFDLQLSTTAGALVWVSASTSTVLAGTGAVILQFRDVTAERGLETELRSTKEFLERLIDSTVDAIIAADFKGQIILFNQGAERLFGYRARDVLHKVPVWKL